MRSDLYSISEQTMFKKQLIREINRNFIKILKTSSTDRPTLAPMLLCFLSRFYEEKENNQIYCSRESLSLGFFIESCMDSKLVMRGY